ncbi:MAG: M55 family metallopeptidase [Rickettsiales bacterium]|jgi:D-amino peptidase|nr:M55 family metallopeptidase [Rickettsiales bacterium]
MADRKIFISADMEGIAQARRWGDVDKGKKSYAKFAKIQSREVAEIIAGFGRGKFVVRDAHCTGKNIMPGILPGGVKILSGWEGENEFCTMSGLDAGGFDCAILHGYHAAAGTKLSPLAHSYNFGAIKEIRLNGKIAGETTFGIYSAAYLGVPVALVAGDSGACAEAKSVNSKIIVCETKNFSKGELPDPGEVLKKLRACCARAAKGGVKVALPKLFDLGIVFTKKGMAPIAFKTNDFREILKALRQAMK